MKGDFLLRVLSLSQRIQKFTAIFICKEARLRFRQQSLNKRDGTISVNWHQQSFVRSRWWAFAFRPIEYEEQPLDGNRLVIRSVTLKCWIRNLNKFWLLWSVEFVEYPAKSTDTKFPRTNDSKFCERLFSNCSVTRAGMYRSRKFIDSCTCGRHSKYFGWRQAADTLLENWHPCVNLSKATIQILWSFGLV